MLEDLYPQAVEAGISSTDFWAMTFDEIMVQVEANKKRHENELKEKAMFDYSQQRLAIYAFNDPKNFPKYEDAYPFLNQLKEEVVQAVSEEEEKKKAMLTDQEIMRQNAMLIQETRKRKSQKKN
ncbi:prophage protein [Lactococcus cremoris]|nr:prophage protein [Lactococcus cremoris]